jgi:molecular chaperone GrpE
LTPEVIEAVLADFRSWLQRVPAPQSCPPPAESPPRPSASEAVDLHTLLGQFIALRHEVNLQTRATRGQQEQSAEALGQLTQALEALHEAAETAQRADSEAREEEVRPLVKTLVEAADALSLARREILRLRQMVFSSLERLQSNAEPAAAPEDAAPAGFWSRWFGSTNTATDQARRERQLLAQTDRQSQAEEITQTVRQLLEALLTGYAMSLQRIQRALEQQGLEPIACVGEAFDPERMEVMEAVGDSGRPSGEVLEEIRPGYLWRGRVFRYAQVRVSRGGDANGG